MSSVVVAAVLGIVAAVEAPRNEVYQILTEEGVSADGVQKTLPPPLMSVGLGAAPQQGKLLEAAKQVRGGLSALLDGSVACEINSGKTTNGYLHEVDIYFVVDGDPEILVDPAFHQQLQNAMGNNAAAGGDARGVALTPDDLARREIAAPGPNEGYGHGGFILLDKVEVESVGRSYYSTLDDGSLVLASMIDPRFVADPDYPNRWRNVRKQPGGDYLNGEWSPYGGSGSYTKITPLLPAAGDQPTDKMFVETHFVLYEPKLWFGNPRELVRKIPLIAEEQAKQIQRQILKFVAAQKAAQK